ncbi:UNKNOWN [Stylonychia lemnae]|uniref:LITAF domain-containing protein n=1 Tax=Stylonychia lemnae TaxID=5949 RepID=A0A078A942_STYLE|nr:UNKNOWN [Stylonychia lemnae]|eukprot:CDW78744.1 UNKNOWN [Stylonychia lemnae]
MNGKGAPMPQVVYIGINGEAAHCPNCKSSTMIKTRRCSNWTWAVCCCLGGPASMTKDWAWQKEMKCLGCQHIVKV